MKRKKKELNREIRMEKREERQRRKKKEWRKRKEEGREGKEKKGLSGFVSPGKIFCSYPNAKVRAVIYKKASASGAQRPPDPFPGFCPWTPLESFCFSDPVTLRALA